jgi:hypothetical protein
MIACRSVETLAAIAVDAAHASQLLESAARALVLAGDWSDRPMPIPAGMRELARDDWVGRGNDSARQRLISSTGAHLSPVSRPPRTKLMISGSGSCRSRLCAERRRQFTALHAEVVFEQLR